MVRAGVARPYSACRSGSGLNEGLGIAHPEARMGRALAAAVRQNSGRSTSQMEFRVPGTDAERGRQAAACVKRQSEHEARRVAQTTCRLSAAIETRGLTFELSCPRRQAL